MRRAEASALYLPDGDLAPAPKMFMVMAMMVMMVISLSGDFVDGGGSEYEDYKTGVVEICGVFAVVLEKITIL